MHNLELFKSPKYQVIYEYLVCYMKTAQAEAFIKRRMPYLLDPDFKGYTNKGGKDEGWK